MLRSDDLLALADRLAAGTTEVEWRTAINRAYYAAAHEATALALASGLLDGERVDLHRVPRQLAGMRGPHGWAVIAGIMLSLKDRRERADYVVEAVDDLSLDARRSVELAAEAIRRMRSTPLPAPRG